MPTDLLPDPGLGLHLLLCPGCPGCLISSVWRGALYSCWPLHRWWRWSWLVGEGLHHAFPLDIHTGGTQAIHLPLQQRMCSSRHLDAACRQPGQGRGVGGISSRWSAVLPGRSISYAAAAVLPLYIEMIGCYSRDRTLVQYSYKPNSQPQSVNCSA